MRRLMAIAHTALVPLASLAALAAFCWPFLQAALPGDAGRAAPVVAIVAAVVLAAAVAMSLANGARGAMLVAMLGTLTAVGMVLRFLGTGFGGIETSLILLILAGRAFGPRFGFLLGATVMLGSAMLWGGVGPWLPFQVFAAGWVGAGAGLLPRLSRRRRPLPHQSRRHGRARPGHAALAAKECDSAAPYAELALLAGYGIVAAYVFGLLMNVWFWPFAVGSGTSISYDGAAGLGDNLVRFISYSLVTSTLTWDTVRAITTVVGVMLIGRPVLAALRRSPLAR